MAAENNDRARWSFEAYFAGNISLGVIEYLARVLARCVRSGYEAGTAVVTAEIDQRPQRVAPRGVRPAQIATEVQVQRLMAVPWRGRTRAHRVKFQVTAEHVVNRR